MRQTRSASSRTSSSASNAAPQPDVDQPEGVPASDKRSSRFNPLATPSKPSKQSRSSLDRALRYFQRLILFFFAPILMGTSGCDSESPSQEIESSPLKPISGYLWADAEPSDLATVDESPAFDPVVTNLIEEALSLMARVSQARTRDLQALWDLMDAIRDRTTANLEKLCDFDEVQRQLALAQGDAASLREELRIIKASML